MAQNNLRQNKVILYNLKREFGTSIKFKRLISRDINFDTGKMETEYETVPVLKAVVLPLMEARTFSYPLAYIAANRNFTYGALFDKRETSVIIDRKDLPRDYEINLDDRVIYGGSYYEITDLVKLPENAGVGFNMKAVGPEIYE
jgi:hypothetical protein